MLLLVLPRQSSLAQAGRRLLLLSLLHERYVSLTRNLRRLWLIGALNACVEELEYGGWTSFDLRDWFRRPGKVTMRRPFILNNHNLPYLRP
jgi:hypothetical protein